MNESERLIGLYREMAAGGENFHGLTVLQHRKEIGALIRRHGVRSLLDYGCGRGDAYRSPHKVWREWGLHWSDVWLYDPAFPQLERMTQRTMDMVICSDVLEHVPEDAVTETIRTLFAHANKVVWASVCCREAKKTFPQTGENLHVTVRPIEWWRDQFDQTAAGLPYKLTETP